MRNTVITIHGSYYNHNYGDFLLLQIFADWIKEVCSDVQINYLHADREMMEELPEGTSGFKGLLHSKAMIYCGGGYFGEPSKNVKQWSIRNFRRHLLGGLIAVLFRIPVALIGVEFGPLSVGWYRRLSLFIARHAKIVVVRNRESKAFLDSYKIKNVIFLPDPIFALSDRYSPLTHDQRTDKVALHVHAIALEPDRYKFLVEALISAIKTLGRKTEIVFLEDDYLSRYQQKKAKTIFRLLEDEGIGYSIFKYNGSDSIIQQINEVSYVITSKLHVGITAAALNVKVLSLWNEPKTPRHHAVMNNSHNCMPISQVDSSIREKFISFMQTDEYTLPSEIKENARLNKKYTQDFIKNYLTE